MFNLQYYIISEMNVKSCNNIWRGKVVEHLRCNKILFGNMTYRQIADLWATVSVAEKAKWQEKAEKEQHLRAQLKSKAFVVDEQEQDCDSGMEEQDHPGSPTMLSRSQRRRLDGARLDKTLQSVSEHAVWSSGLGLGNHLAPLRPEFVVDSQTDKELKEGMGDIMGFDRSVVPNVQKPPIFKKACALLTGGVCHCSSHYAVTCSVVNQLQDHIAQAGLEADVPLCCFEMVPPCATSSSSSSSSSTLNAAAKYWGVLGNVGKRPVVHILARYSHISLKALQLSVVQGEPQIESSHQIVQRMCREFVVAGGTEDKFGMYESWLQQVKHNFCAHMFLKFSWFWFWYFAKIKSC